MALDQIKDKTDGPPWSELPIPAVEEIYSFLNRSDQISMSLVCRNWRREYSSPSLWRKVTVEFPDLEHMTEMCPGVIFARRFGVWFHHVKISSRWISPDLPFPADSETVIWQLKLFLEALACQSQLLSISFELEFLQSFIDFPFEVADVRKMISDFMKSQKRLQFVSMDDLFGNPHEIVKALSPSITSGTLRHLEVWNFYLEEPEDADIRVDDDLNFLVFMNLEILEIEYSQAFEEMVLSFYKCRNKVDMRRRKGFLKELRLNYCCYREEVNGIHPPVWKYFREIYPGLRIDLEMYSECDSISLSTFIVREMPLKTLYFEFTDYRGHGDGKEVGILLRHITSCGINLSLEVLSIHWTTGFHNNISPDLISFTNACPELKELTLHLAHPVAGLDSVFNSWIQHRPLSLHSVYISVSLSYPTQEAIMIYTNLNESYAPLLQQLELSLSVRPRY